MSRGWFGPRSEEYRERQRRLMLGREITWCDKLSEAHRGNKHSDETKRRMSAAHKGRTKSAKTRKRMSDAQHHRHLDGCSGCAVCARYAGPTDLELALRRMLCEAGFNFEEQRPFYTFNVDAWVPSHQLVFEADGEPWHTWNEEKSPGYHRRRERFLLTQGIAAVIHLTRDDLQPWIGDKK